MEPRAAVALAAATLLAVLAARTAPEARQEPVQVPVAASSVARFPDRYVGTPVNMTATVERVVSRTAFVVDQSPTASTGQEVLVLATVLIGPVELNEYVTVQGLVERFDAAMLERDFGDYLAGLPADVSAAFAGKPVVLATAVINSAMEDLTKVPPPPMSADERAFAGLMRRVSPAFSALRSSLQAENAADASEQVAVLETAFGEVERFFAGRNAEDAVTWAREAQDIVAFTKEAIESGYLDVASSTAGNLTRLCQSCHSSYRTQLEDGSYRIRSGGG
jgi:hypothetical protein